MTLTEFLLDRIEEDEDVARDAAGWNLAGTTRDPGQWSRDGANSVIDSQRRSVVYGDGPAPGNPQAEHIVRHDPARVLAECEAKRRIVEDLTAHLEADHAAMESPVASASWHAKATTLKSVTHLLALSYVDHPDYDEAWRP